MRDARRGIVYLDYAGDTIPLRFTWRVIDGFGRTPATELLEKAGSGEPGDLTALATLLEAASGGRLTAAALLDDGELPFAEAYMAVIQAWALAARRPGGAQRAENPLIRLWTWLRTLCRRLWRQVCRKANSGS